MTRRGEAERIGRIARGQHGLVTRAQLLGIGLSAKTIDRRVAAGELAFVHRGVYRVGPLVAPRAREMAALLAVGARARVSHFDAGWLWQVLTARDEAAPVEVTVIGGAHGSRPGIRLHRVRRLADDECGLKDGIRVTSVARTILDLAPSLGHGELWSTPSPGPNANGSSNSTT